MSDSKRAACLNCRKSKVKCKRAEGASKCQRCESSHLECIVPNIQMGRKKGSRNKRKGLDNYIVKIEQALKKSSKGDLQDDSAFTELQQLLNRVRDRDRRTSSLASGPSQSRGEETEVDEDDDSPSIIHDEDALDDAENPLELLVRASRLRQGKAQSANVRPPSPGSVNFDRDGYGSYADIQRFFMPIRASIDGNGRGDDDESDPIHLGLVTEEEAEMLLAFFYNHTAYIRWGLDPHLYTLQFTRRRSSFLLTSLLAAAALFMPGSGALSKRLTNHRKTLAHRVIHKRLRSVEIVLAFITVPWIHPGTHHAEYDTALYLSMALTIGLDLGLNKIIRPSLGYNADIIRRTPRANTLDANYALAIDGFEGIDIGTDFARRLLRRRERVWLALFAYERGFSLAQGRSPIVPIDPIVLNCDEWHDVDIADYSDGPLVATVALRRDLHGLVDTVRSRCDSYRMIDVGSNVAEEIEAIMERFYENYLAKWTSKIGTGSPKVLAPMSEIMVVHTRLSTYTSVINHPTAPKEVKHLFRKSALSSALHLMRVAVNCESQLNAIANNTTIMISFAGAVALKLSTVSPGGQVAPSVRSLIEQTADVLIRIGTTPKHRNGSPVIYGKYLKMILSQVPTANDPPQITNAFEPAPSIGPTMMPINETAVIPAFDQSQVPDPNLWNESLQHSVLDANEFGDVFQANQAFDPAFASFSPQDANGIIGFDFMNLDGFGSIM
ncbi:hypothetical protein BT63DRAFT_424843 [Microthyrium microscopicum]|uniref:Zn(2)-C6 fungal-type domain-containing protein n=1 Tax=Microthyrium microscopicum TaxID=703497 RepID=A0A6A6UE15_9PEZI|nr:hypothetical protein BT63DRAFT_424843 [Microthyrium microscopicum]